VKPARHGRILRAAVILILVTLAGGVVAAPAAGHSNNSRGLVLALGWASAVALVAALGFAAWRRGGDATDD
jgi:hypothetical protein